MIRSDHFFYDLREVLGSPKLLMTLLVVAGFFTFWVNFQFVYLFALLFVTIFAARALIGRRCPQCDSPMKEIGAEPDKTNAFVISNYLALPPRWLRGKRDNER